jgi:hybrid cluster-associated redox disulfide protein
MKKIIKKTTKKKELISKKMTFAELLNKSPESANILFESGLHCIGCGGAMYETIEQGCLMHGFSKKQIDDLIKKLNKENK